MKLRIKHREGSQVSRQYEPAQTPYHRLVSMRALSAEAERHLTRVYQQLAPVHLLQQVQTLQDALWRHAVLERPTNGAEPVPSAPTMKVRFDVNAGGEGGSLKGCVNRQAV